MQNHNGCGRADNFGQWGNIEYMIRGHDQDFSTWIDQMHISSIAICFLWMIWSPFFIKTTARYEIIFYLKA